MPVHLAVRTAIYAAVGGLLGLLRPYVGLGHVIVAAHVLLSDVSIASISVRRLSVVVVGEKLRDGLLAFVVVDLTVVKTKMLRAICTR